MPEAAISSVGAKLPAGPERFVGSRPAFELLESKLRPPQGRGGTVPRTRLMELLDDQASAIPVVFLSSGPGWGKTTALAQWASRTGRPFAWVQLDESDNDPIVLLTYVAASLGRISPLDPGVFEALTSPGISVEATIVPRLGAALAAMDPQIVLVLDDLHVLDNATCLDAIGTLARHVPEGSKLALSARGEPPPWLAAMRARGLALEIGPDALRMDEAEAHQLLVTAGLDLPDEEVAELTEHTEGWPAGLYLAALSIRARGVRAQRAATFSGRDRLVSDYLGSELLAHLSVDDVRFLTRSAVLDRITGPLCDATLEMSGSAAILESLARSNLFVVPLDAHGEWYRYHYLFQEQLRSELERAEPDVVPGLLARAAAWSETHEQPEAAIRYMQAAGDVDGVARLVEQCTIATYQRGGVETVERWLDWITRHGGLERNAAVAVLGALVATVSGRPTEADRLADAAERGSYDRSLPDGSPSIDSWLALLRAHRCRRGVARMREDAELAVGTLAPGSPNRPHAVLLLGISWWLEGEADRADDLFADAAEEGLALGAPESAAVSLAERAVIAIERGAWSQAEEFVDRALRLIRRSRMEAYPTSTLLYAMGARVAIHRGDTKGSIEFLGRAQRLRPRLSYALPHLSVQTRLELARAYLHMADSGGAWTMLGETDALLRRQPDLGVLPAQVQEVRSSLRTMHAEAPGASSLTEAELRVLPYLATHLSFREVGDRLYISRHTVKSHAMAIYRKLNVTSRNAAVERASESGLLL